MRLFFSPVCSLSFPLRFIDYNAAGRDCLIESAASLPLVLEIMRPRCYSVTQKTDKENTVLKIGCALAGGSFMPEVKGGAPERQTAFERLTLGYNQALAMGFDYIEASAGEILALSAGELDALIELRLDGEFAVRYVNSFVRADLKICTADKTLLEQYVYNAVGRIAALGAGVIIFGSGKAREYPASMTHAEGMEKFLDFTKLCARAAGEYGIKIALEPLNRGETNILNSVAEGVRTARELNLPEVVVLADAFHMALEGETAEVVVRNADLISHLHISEAPGRYYPGKNGGEYLIRFARELKKAGFAKDATVECCFDDFTAEGPKALRFIKEEMLWGSN